MDPSTIKQIADMICGDSNKYPVYRSSWYLTEFFKDINLPYKHDGSTRKLWVLEILKKLNEEELRKVILRLADPKLYADKKLVTQALVVLNSILEIEGLKIQIEGVIPKLVSIIPNFNLEEVPDKRNEEQQELKPLSPPNFDRLDLEVGMSNVLIKRWEEIEKCIKSEATLASVILMGSLLEGLLLGVVQRFPNIANRSSSAPKDADGKVKKFHEWKLGEMIDTAADLRWISVDRQKFSHVLRDFRNLIHPYQQLSLKTHPDLDTCRISWLVVQAACNDISTWVENQTKV